MTPPSRGGQEIGLRTRRVVYGSPPEAELAAEMTLLARVDQAHLVMLAERRLVPAAAARELLGAIAGLVGDEFRALRGRPAPRGLYLMYEGYLIERLGADTGGVLHTGRSRNDLKATITCLRLRDWLLDFGQEATRLQAVLLSRARAHRSVLMPVYTHFQAAMPVTYGYYLLGVAFAVGRAIDALRAASDALDRCPLGAGGVAGTDLPIDAGRTAGLLGFGTPVRHAVDAVASRDVPLRVLSAATEFSVTVSRLATDLQLWSTAEFGLVSFPDRLVGGSSAMPQKRNAFLLEHIKAKPAQALGAWAGAAAAMAATPFTNSIEVGTEAMAVLWPGLTAARESAVLAQVTVSGARPVPARMSEAAARGFTAATALANRLVRGGIAFRTAHSLVGQAVREAAAAGSADPAAFATPEWPEQARTGLGPAEAVALSTHGGGPGCFDSLYQQAVADWAGHRDWRERWRRRVGEADAALGEALARLLAGRDQ
jgi:argininosuccinate lyase